MQKTGISAIKTSEILDSRGNPTVQCRVTLECGATGCASVPSGASTGKYEAYEKRDGGARFGGRGVLEVCKKAETELFEHIRGKDASDQKLIDGLLIKADGTNDRSRYGANTLLAVSLSCARATANACGLPLYRYLGGIIGSSMPVPMMNVINGGMHADNGLDIQEFMIVPIGAKSLRDGVLTCAEIYSHLKARLKRDGFSTAVGDEGGFAPELASDEEALEYLCLAISDAGYGTDRVKLALDVAASSWAHEGGYKTAKSGKHFTSEALAEKLLRLAEKYPIISIEDPLGCRLGDLLKLSSGIIGKNGKASIISDKPVTSLFKPGVTSGKAIPGNGKVLWDGMYINSDKDAIKSGISNVDYNSAKIMIRQTGDRIIAGVDYNNLLALNNIHIGNSQVPDLDLEELCSYLNSPEMVRYYQAITLESGRAMAQIDLETLRELPVICKAIRKKS